MGYGKQKEKTIVLYKSTVTHNIVFAGYLW